MTGKEQTALILSIVVAAFCVVSIVAGAAGSDPRSRLHRPALAFFAVFEFIGRLGWLWAALGALLVLSQCQEQAYKDGYRAHVEECMESIVQCRGGGVP